MGKNEVMNAVRFLFESKLKQFSADTLTAWYMSLKDYPEDEVVRAVREVSRDPVDFINVGTVIDRMRPPDVGKAWERVVSVASGGCRLWQKLTDLEIAAVSAIGGMQAIQNSDEEGLRFLFNDFQRQYPVMVRRHATYSSDDERLKDLNATPETYQFLKNTTLPEIGVRSDLVRDVGKRISA
jgi:hypothetical protein